MGDYHSFHTYYFLDDHGRYLRVAVPSSGGRPEAHILGKMRTLPGNNRAELIWIPLPITHAGLYTSVEGTQWHYDNLANQVATCPRNLLPGELRLTFLDVSGKAWFLDENDDIHHCESCRSENWSIRKALLKDIHPAYTRGALMEGAEIDRIFPSKLAAEAYVKELYQRWCEKMLKEMTERVIKDSEDKVL